ncbi:MAG: aldehyde ferredoxin oxidoreductase family protein [Desulfobacteraceae bacterium]|nr:aldehyde ferredoxin oxidoreductase family protein [Desulfobacteraceae bacterium]
MSGYWGKVLRVDLTEGKITIDSLPEEWRKAYIGGTGLSAKILYDEVPAGADPLGPENLFIFSVGPFQGGSKVLGSGRFTVCAKSPLTGIFGESLGGGYNAEEFKKAGFDALVVKGKSQKPVYLWIHDGEAELKDASHLWGKTDTFETEDAIKDELGDRKVQVAPIGPAAENLVRYAGLICNYGHGCAGRTGMGTVMGSKNLKAIAFRGTQTVPIARPEELEKLKKELLAIAKDADFTKANRELGQAMAVVPREENGLLPMKNFLLDRWPDGAKKLGAGEGQDFNSVLKPKPDACSNCIMGCHRRVTISKDKYAMDSYGPEYETLGMIGSDCLIDNLLAVNKANELCNRYSLDTIEFGGICAFAMEAYEAGKITKDDLGGIELKWGDADAMLALLEKIAKREGDVPRILGEGMRVAAEKLGVSDPLHVNGAVVPAHDPRAFLSMAVATATSMKGASHLHGFPEAIELGVTFPETGLKELREPLDPHSPTHKGLAAAKFQDRMAVCNSVIFCFFYEFSGLDFTRLTGFLNAITGWDILPQELLKTGERIINLMNMFNIKHGMKPSRDYQLPKRFLTPHPKGGAANVEMPFDDMLNEYYSVRDWPNGVPSQGKLKELGLDFCL